jgi:hypothetical protein
MIELSLLLMPNLLAAFCITFELGSDEANALLFGSKFFDFDLCTTCKEFRSCDFLLSGFTKFFACFSFFNDSYWPDFWFFPSYSYAYKVMSAELAFYNSDFYSSILPF